MMTTSGPNQANPLERVLVTGGSGFIGTNLIELIRELAPTACLVNVDITPPRDSSHSPYYVCCDVNDLESLSSIVEKLSPTHIFHLAAATGIGDLPLEHFRANIQGVENVVKVSANCNSLKSVIFASSLLVCRVGYIPESDQEYCPTTTYGISKMRGEIAVKSTGSSIPWTIVRPISIWGPWNSEPYTQFFRSVLCGLYFNIGKFNSIRSLGYVKNTVYQLVRLSTAEASLVSGKVFYLADYEPSSLRQMASRISSYRRFRCFIPTMPYLLARALACLGDLFWLVTNKQPLFSTFRLHNLVTEYVFDLSSLRSVCGPIPFDIEQGIRDTIKWMKLRSRYK